MSTMWPKERPPLLLTCPESLGRCWGRSRKLPCPPVHLLHNTLDQARTMLHAQISSRTTHPQHWSLSARKTGTIWPKERPPLLLKCPKSLGRCWGRSEKLPYPQSTSFTSLLAKPADSCTLKFQPAPPTLEHLGMANNTMGLKRDSHCF